MKEQPQRIRIDVPRNIVTRIRYIAKLEDKKPHDIMVKALAAFVELYDELGIKFLYIDDVNRDFNGVVRRSPNGE